MGALKVIENIRCKTVDTSPESVDLLYQLKGENGIALVNCILQICNGAFVSKKDWSDERLDVNAEMVAGKMHQLFWQRATKSTKGSVPVDSRFLDPSASAVKNAIDTAILALKGPTECDEFRRRLTVDSIPIGNGRSWTPSERSCHRRRMNRLTRAEEYHSR